MIFFEVSTELLKLLIKGIDEVKEKLDGIENRLRDVEKAIAENIGRHSGLVTAKDIFIVLCAVGALLVSLVRLTQG